MNTAQLHSLFLECNSVNTDTRSIKKGDLFFALKGENFNGNKFAEKALELGAKYTVVDEQVFAINDKYILVDNVLESLQKLATYHRDFLDIPILALTGSNGKTTTKELINSVLSRKFKTVATIGNLNNHIGVPLTLLSMNNKTEFGIVEMGANHQQEIAFLTNIAKPNYGYITNFGKAHIEGFGGVDGIIKGKSELYDYLSINNQFVFVNENDPIQMQKTENIDRFIFGNNINSDVNISLSECNPNVVISYQDIEIKSNLIGEYNFSNIAAAIAIGCYFKVNAKDIQSAIESYIPNNNRSQILTIGSNKIILDAYNANPTSMEAAIQNLSQLKIDTKKILVLGDMFELGETSDIEHQAIVDLILQLNFDLVVLVGNLFYKTKTPEATLKYRAFNDFKELFDFNQIEDSTVLIKGSRGMALERVVPILDKI